MKAKRVLIAAADHAWARALKIRCDQLGLATTTVSDGMTAFQEIRDNPPDLLILDVNMPVANGLYLSEELQQETGLAPIPVIILTGMNDKGTIRKCERLGAHHVWKGLDTWNQLESVIVELLGLDRQPKSPNKTRGTASEPATPSCDAEDEDAARDADDCRSGAFGKILVIDDDPQIPRALKLRIESYGLDVCCAFAGMQGYWMALREKPDAVITDFSMPDGYANYIVSKLREHSITARTPIIVVTGRPIDRVKDNALRRELDELGVSDILAKPVDFEEVLAALRKNINFPVQPVRAPAFANS